MNFKNRSYWVLIYGFDYKHNNKNKLHMWVCVGLICGFNFIFGFQNLDEKVRNLQLKINLK